MRFHYDKKEDALYIRFHESPYRESEEVHKGVIFDYNKEGRIVGIELLDASRRLPAQFQAEIEQKRIPLILTVE